MTGIIPVSASNRGIAASGFALKINMVVAVTKLSYERFTRIPVEHQLGTTAVTLAFIGNQRRSDIEIEAREILRMKDMLNHSLADMSGQTFEKIEKDTDRDYFLSAQEAMDYGLIDRVISHPNEA